MNSKRLFIAGSIAALTSTTANAAVRLRNPLWSLSLPMNVAFEWQIHASSGPTPWSEYGGYVEGVEDYVDVDDQACGCPDGYTAPCYMVADASTASWEPW